MKLRRISTLSLALSPALALFVYACGGDDTTQPPGNDAGPDVTVDAKVDAKVDGASDAKADASDGGVSGTSKQIQDVRNAATAPVSDAGSDAASDATVSDAASEASVTDASSDAAVDGGGGIPVNNLPIDNATVTYVKPAVGSDPAGFFIQAEKAGPAIFVAVDPTTLNPVPVAGDEVSFKVTAVANVSQLRQVVALTGWTRVSQGKDLTALLQDISAAADPVTNLDGYESEYIKLTATTATAFGSAGTGSVSAQITTTGVGAPSTSFRARFPATVQDSLDLSNGCSFTLTGAMWRFTSQAQPSGWVDGDVTAIVCPAPTVLSATATADTTVIVTFDRKIDGTSLLANGSQFTVNNGLTVTAAVLSGPRQVTLTTTAQTPTQPYTVTVASTLKDTKGKFIGNTGNTANFVGFVIPAVVRINELGPNISGADLLELRVVTAGNLTGITIEEYLNNAKTTLTTLPLLQVAVDDLVVVHFTAPVGVTDETSSKTGCADAACYPLAWDVKGTTNNGLTNNARVVIARSPANGAIQDGIAYHRSAGATPSANYYIDVNTLAAANHWVGCNGACADNTAALPFSVDFNGVGTNATGQTIRRISNTDTNAKADWAVGAHSWGVANP